MSDSYVWLYIVHISHAENEFVMLIINNLWLYNLNDNEISVIMARSTMALWDDVYSSLF